jgi:hypothetical protein
LIPVEAQSTQIYVQIYIQMSKFMAFTLSWYEQKHNIPSFAATASSLSLPPIQ